MTAVSLLTPSLIVREALVTFCNNVGHRSIGAQLGWGPRKIERVVIGIRFPETDLALPLEQFSSKHVLPMVLKLLEFLPYRALIEPIEAQSALHEVCVEHYRGVYMRVQFAALPNGACDPECAIEFAMNYS